MQQGTEASTVTGAGTSPHTQSSAPILNAEAVAWTATAVIRTFWAGWAASVWVVVLATIAVHLGPHTRAIGFFPELRFAVVAPACAFLAIATAFIYAALSTRLGGPRSALATGLLALAVILVLGMALDGPPGLAVAALPAVVTVAGAVTWLVPRFVARPRRSRLGTVAIVLVGALEIVGVGSALSSEAVAPPHPGLAFDIPRPMFDVEHRFVTLPSGARVHYVDEGSGETLLFLHGNPSWSFQWRDLIDGLRHSYRCVALDYPGFGLSEAPPVFGFTPREESAIVEEFVDHLGLRDMTLVMQDWGGPIGLGLAGRRPELVRRVVLGSTWAWQTPIRAPRGQFSVVAGGPIGEFVQLNFNGFSWLAITSGVVRALPPDTVDVYTRPFRPLRRRGIAAFYPGQITSATTFFAEVEAGLPRLAAKEALIFWALQDPGFPREDLTRFQQVFPNNKTIEFANASHFFFEDEAEAMIHEMKTFMSSGLTTR